MSPRRRYRKPPFRTTVPWFCYVRPAYRLLPADQKADLLNRARANAEALSNGPVRLIVRVREP